MRTLQPARIVDLSLRKGSLLQRAAAGALTPLAAAFLTGFAGPQTDLFPLLFGLAICAARAVVSILVSGWRHPPLTV